MAFVIPLDHAADCRNVGNLGIAAAGIPLAQQKLHILRMVAGRQHQIANAVEMAAQFVRPGIMRGNFRFWLKVTSTVPMA